MKKTWVCAVALALAACGQVDPGEVATFVTWGKMHQQSYGQGFYWYNPVSTNMDTISVQVMKFEAKKLGAATSDVQEIHADIVVNYRLVADAVHKLITETGHDYEAKVIVPAVTDALKAGTAHFNLATIIRDREKLRAMVRDDLKARMRFYYIEVVDINLTNFDVSKQFSLAVEAKQIEEQKAEQKKWQVVQAQRDAKVAAAAAKGLADAAREAAKGKADALRTEAQAQAEYNAKVSASLTPILVQQQAVEAWQAGGSQVPQFTGVGGALIQVPMPAARAKVGD